MRRTSKYLNKTFDNNWTCTHIGVARVQGKIKMHHKGKSKRPGHQTYYYVFERPTSDNKAEKLVRLSAAEAAKVYRGELAVEAVVETRQQRGAHEFTEKVSYHFIDRK